MKNLLPLMVKEPGFGVLVKCRGICFSNFMHCLLSVYSFIDMSEANYFFPYFFFLSPNLVIFFLARKKKIIKRKKVQTMWENKKLKPI